MAARRVLAVWLATSCVFVVGFAKSTQAKCSSSRDTGERWGSAFLLSLYGSSHAGSLASFQSTGSSPTNQTQDQSDGYSSSKPIHRKTGENSSETIRHVRVEEESEISPELTKAEDLIEKQDYADAEPLLHKVVETDPSSYVAWFDLGFTENGLGKTNDSIAAYRKSVAAKPSVFESNLNLGIQLAKAGQPDAEQYLRAATQLTPTSHVAEGQARAWISLAHVLEKTKPEDAIAAYEQAAKLQPKDAEPHLSAGLLLENDNKFADAESQYKQALALDPSPDALTALANLYMRGRRFPQAEEYLRKLVSAQPENAAAHIQLGRVLAAEGKNDAAVAELEEGAKYAPADLSVQRDLADLYLTLGKNEQAEVVYRSLLTKSPNDPELRRNLGQSLLQEKKYAEAQQEFLMAVKLKPDFGEAYFDLAYAAGENQNYPLAIKALDVRAKFLPEIPITYFLRASAYDHLKDFKKAAESYHLFLNVANGKYPEQEWQAKHRLIAIEPKK
jgi:tetratricopeptide (TPR) repeat protein